MKRFSALFVTYLLLTFVIAAAWHLVIFKGVYDELGIFTRRDPVIPLGLTAMAMQAAVLAYIYPLFDRGRDALKDGLRFCLLVGVLMASIAVFAEAGKQYVSSLTTWLTLESGYYLLQFSVVGVALAFTSKAVREPKTNR